MHRPQQKIPSSSARASASKRKRSRVGGAKDRAESPHVNHTPIRSGRSPGSAVAGNRWKETGFVFTTTVGTPLDGPTVSRQFRRLLEKAGFRPMRFHDLRHVSASLPSVSGHPSPDGNGDAWAQHYLCNHEHLLARDSVSAERVCGPNGCRFCPSGYPSGYPASSTQRRGGTKLGCILLKTMVPGVGLEPSAVLYYLQVTDSYSHPFHLNHSKWTCVVRELYTGSPQNDLAPAL